MPKVILKSCDNQKFPVDVEIAKMFDTVKYILEDIGVNPEEGEEEEISLPMLRGNILKLAIQWAEQHYSDPPLPDYYDTRERRTDDISQWDQKFLQVEEAVLFDLIMAAEFLDIKGLLDVTCKTVANMIKGQTLKRTAQSIREDTRLMYHLTYYLV